MIKSALAATVRLLRQDAGYAGAFVLTLGLGIGATTAIFSAVEGVLIRPLPYPHADRIVYVQQPLERAGDDNTLFSFVEASDYRTQATTLEEVVEYGDWQFNVVGLGEPRVAFGGLVTSGLFQGAGHPPVLGRVLQRATRGDGQRRSRCSRTSSGSASPGADPGSSTAPSGDRVWRAIVGVLEPGSLRRDARASSTRTIPPTRTT